MDPEKRLRRQSLRVMISETLMVVTVAITVLILAFVVSGYWLGSDFKVERQGMLQISSVPTGADIFVDGETAWLQRTNTSKVLSTGEHEISLKKEGYDTWTKTITIKDGLLYRLHYPRLFLNEREKSVAYDVTSTTFATVSPNRNLLLLANDTTKWLLLKLDSDVVKAEPIDISTLFTSVSIADGAASGIYNGIIASADWDRDNEHILFKSVYGETYEWAILNVKNPERSINLTREFVTKFDQVKIFNNSASMLLALNDGNLRRIDVSTKEISPIIAKDVANFNFYDREIILSTKTDNGYDVAIIKGGEGEYDVITTTEAPARATALRFYDEDYIAIQCEQKITLLKKSDQEEVFSGTLDFIPTILKVAHGGDFIVMSDGGQIATLDMEAMAVRPWSIGTDKYGWLDGGMIYAVEDGLLTVYDYDGFNKRSLAHNVSSKFPVTITSDKWLYYFSDNRLIREVIVK